MNITLTPIELNKIVRSHYGFGSDVELNVRIADDVENSKVKGLRRIFDEIRSFRYRTDQKISAIKAFRETSASQYVTSMDIGVPQAVSLYTAKFAVEHLEEYEAECFRRGRLYEIQ